MNRSTVRRLTAWTALLALIMALPAGCGGETAETPETGQPQKSSAENSAAKSGSTPQPGGNKKTSPPVASVNGKKPAGRKQGKSAPPKHGTPQWYVHQMLLLRFRKYPDTDDVKKLQQLRRERNLEIIKLAEEAVALTNKDKQQQEVFNAAVHQLIESRVALALQGREEDIVALYDLADVLFKRDKTSKAAAEAAYKVAVFANTNAMRYPDPKTGWLDEFVRRARLFATDFPQEKARAVRLLDVAGRSCELHGRIDDAIKCYEQLRREFPDMIQAKYAIAVLRRLKLPGRIPEISGPTIDGGFLDLKDYKGKVVLVAFWATDRKRCKEILPKLKTLGERYKKHGFEIIGVNLDAEEPPVDAYLEQAKLTWPQIFYPNRNKRRWENPTAKFYAVRRLPTLWLIDAGGKVVETRVDPAQLEGQVRGLLQRRVSAKR